MEHGSRYGFYFVIYHLLHTNSNITYYSTKENYHAFMQVQTSSLEGYKLYNPFINHELAGSTVM